MSKKLREEVLRVLEDEADKGSAQYKEIADVAKVIERPAESLRRPLEVLEGQGFVEVVRYADGSLPARITPSGSLYLEGLQEDSGDSNHSITPPQSAGEEKPADPGKVLPEGPGSASEENGQGLFPAEPPKTIKKLAWFIALMRKHPFVGILILILLGGAIAFGLLWRDLWGPKIINIAKGERAPVENSPHEPVSGDGTSRPLPIDDAMERWAESFSAAMNPLFAALWRSRREEPSGPACNRLVAHVINAQAIAEAPEEEIEVIFRRDILERLKAGADRCRHNSGGWADIGYAIDKLHLLQKTMSERYYLQFPPQWRGLWSDMQIWCDKLSNSGFETLPTVVEALDEHGWGCPPQRDEALQAFKKISRSPDPQVDDLLSRIYGVIESRHCGEPSSLRERIAWGEAPTIRPAVRDSIRSFQAYVERIYQIETCGSA